MASLQEVVEQLVTLAAEDIDGTDSGSATFTTSASGGPITLLTTIIRKLFSASDLRNWAILLVMGSLFEIARRLLSSLWDASIDAFFITAMFQDDDVSFKWIMHWLSKQPSWERTRNVEISTFDFGLDTAEFDDSNHESRKLVRLPAVSTSFTLWYKYRRISITREVQTNQSGWKPSREILTISILSRDHRILEILLQEVKNAYIEAQRNSISIYVPDSDSWRVLSTHPKRPLSTIILDPGILQLVVDDVRDFLGSKQWYAERGIPFRRGYLLYGAPGSGKTSLIQSIAGELGLDVYIVSLSRSGLDDIVLAKLLSELPERCIALMEDIDAAFHHGVNRESPDDTPDHNECPPPPTSNSLSLSGLLNALDGIGAQEGRVLFATTNKYGSLDPALCRPGRMDLHIEFKLASRYQAKELFRRFYVPSSSATPREPESKHECENGCADAGAGEDPLINLSEPQSQSKTSPASSTSTPSASLLSLSRSSSPSILSDTEKHDETKSLGTTSRLKPTYTGNVHSRRAPTLSHDQVDALAAQFALAVPERQLSMASLQGYLMMYKSRPFAAVTDIGAWAEKEKEK